MASGKPRVVPPVTSLDLSDLSGPLLLALLGGDESAVEGIVSRARSRGADTALVVRDLVMPALSEVGRMWARGEVSIAEEHLATALVARVLGRSSGSAAPAAAPAGRIVFACLAGEFHDLGIRFLADVARECGWDGESLGANVPREALVRFVSQRPPAALALSLSLAGHVPEAARTIAEIRAVAPETTVFVGGHAFREDPALVRLAGADAAFVDAVALRDWLLAKAKETRKGVPNGVVRRGLPETIPAALRRKVSRPR